MNTEILQKAATEARGLAIDAVHAAGIGHLGLPLGAAEMGAVLYGHTLEINPNAPRWINRDRFVLSAGHGSIFLYAWLHLSGFDLPMEEIRNFRQLHSKTPGHPEFGETPGVESTTGPLGQGIGNAVGMAVSAKMAEQKFNTADHAILDHHIFCLAGDGCLQEGIAAEACSFAGHNGLDNLILILDSNDVTLDAPADRTQSEDTAKRYEAYGFDVATVNGHDLTAFATALGEAKNTNNSRPKLIIAKTEIGRGIPEVAGTSKAHGEGGAKFADSARRRMGLPDETFFVSDEVRSYFAEHKNGLIKKYEEWLEVFSAWKSANPEKAALLETGLSGKAPQGLFDEIPEFPSDANIATRAAGGKILQHLAQALPLLVSGSADLYGSTKNYIPDGGDFGRDNFAGRNIWFGIREHAMAAILNGFAYEGFFRASGATFMAFSDYMRPSIRLAALSKLPVNYIFTHDSVAVGEDGPTHQPVEMVSSLRCVPNLDVIRPADPEETAGAFVAALERTEGPTAIVLTRQNVPNQNQISVSERRNGARQGAYVAHREQSELELIILATGSELQHALAAANELGQGVRVVSMPCFERFDRQSADYSESVLPNSCRKRIAIEAGVSALWHRYVGLEGMVVGIDRFGLSAPGDIVMDELGMKPESIVKAANEI